MAPPKVITLEVSPTKSTLSFEVLEPSKVVIKNQTNTNFTIGMPPRAMTISTEPVDDTTVPSLVDDATSSGMSSEDNVVINSGEDETNSSTHFRSRRGDKRTKFVRHARIVHGQSEPSDHDLLLSISTLSSESDGGGSAEYSTTSKSGSVLKNPSQVTKRGHKHHKHHKHQKSRSSRKGSISPGESEDSLRTSGTGESTTRRTGKKGHSSSRWSESEDAILKSMKEGGETWTTIATALGRGKKDVQQRFKEFKAPKEGGARNNKSSLKQNSRTRGKPRSSKNLGKKHSRNDGKSIPQLSWNTADESTSASPGPESIDSDAQQQIYLQDQIRENLYPPYLSLKGGAHFTKRDCEVLATVDSKMKRGKWLEMQANFFNATGKMVPISVFRDRCEAAEADERERIREAKIKSWKAGLDYSVQYDPNEPCEVA